MEEVAENRVVSNEEEKKETRRVKVSRRKMDAINRK